MRRAVLAQRAHRAGLRTGQPQHRHQEALQQRLEVVAVGQPGGEFDEQVTHRRRFGRRVTSARVSVGS